MVHQTNIQKMFEDLKTKVTESKEVENSAESKEQRQKSAKFMDSVSSMLDRSHMTDIETDNEFPNQNSSSDEEIDIGKFFLFLWIACVRSFKVTIRIFVNKITPLHL